MTMKYEICSKCERLLTKSRFTNSNICNSCTEKINTKQTNNQMTKFRVIEGTVWEIEAETLEEAKAIYDAYFIAGDGEELPIKEIQGDSYWYGTEYREGAQDTLCYLSDLYDGVEETDIWKDHFGEGANA